MSTEETPETPETKENKGELEPYLQRASEMKPDDVARLMLEHSELYDEYLVLQAEREDMKAYFRSEVGHANRRTSEHQSRCSKLVAELLKSKQKYNKMKARHKCIAKKSYFYGLNAGKNS